MAYHLQRWKMVKEQVTPPFSFIRCQSQKIFIQFKKFSDSPGNYFGSKGNWSITFGKFFTRLARIQTIFFLMFLFLCAILRNTIIGELIRWPSFHVSNGLKFKKKTKKKKKKEKEMLALTIESLKLIWIKAKYFLSF